MVEILELILKTLFQDLCSTGNKTGFQGLWNKFRKLGQIEGKLKKRFTYALLFSILGEIFWGGGIKNVELILKTLL